MRVDYSEVKEKYTEIIKDLLTQRFGDEIVFDPIVVKADPEVCPDPGNTVIVCLHRIQRG